MFQLVQITINILKPYRIMGHHLEMSSMISSLKRTLQENKGYEWDSRVDLGFYTQAV